MKSILAFLLLVILINCNGQEKKDLKSINPSNKDTLWLKENTVVFISPSLKKIEKLKKEQGDNFYTIADDANYYYANAIEHLDSLHQKYSNQHENIIIAYKDGSKVRIIPKYKNDWYSIAYKNKTFKILDLISFKEAYSLFLNHDSKLK